MTTTLPVGANYTGWHGLGLYANVVTNNLFWPLMLCAICVVVFFVIYKQSGENGSHGFFAASWAFFFLSILMSILGFVPSSYVIISIGLLGFSVLTLALSKDKF